MFHFLSYIADGKSFTKEVNKWKYHSTSETYLVNQKCNLSRTTAVVPFGFIRLISLLPSKKWLSNYMQIKSFLEAMYHIRNKDYEVTSLKSGQAHGHKHICSA